VGARNEGAGRDWDRARLTARPQATGLLYLELSCGCALCFAREETLAAKNRAALGGLKRNCGFPPALRAGGHGLTLSETASRTLALRLTTFAALGLILEILVVKKVLLPRGKYEVRSAIYAFEDAILKLRHGLVSPST